MGTRRRRRGGFAWFFSKQLLAFLALAFLVIVVDFFLYAFIAVWESDQHFDQGSPATLTRRVDAGLVQEAGTWTLDGEAADALDAQEAWALLVDAHGTVAWERGVPADVPRTFSINDVAVAARYGSIEDHPSFFWDRADGLLVVGFPQGSYWSMSFTYPESTMRNLPLYVLLLFGVDFLTLFVYVLRSRRRTLRTVTPVTSALEDLSEGRPVELSLKGDLRDLGEQITETSAIIQRKDRAREQWIRGVSHDIRTPLTMILGYADGMANDPANPADVRAQAAHVRAQALRIKDLVLDLNSASQLSSDLQPLQVETVSLPRLLRAVVASHVNEGHDESHRLELVVEEDAADACVQADERLIVRAVENALANARLHNGQGCSIEVRLSVVAAGVPEPPRKGRFAFFRSRHGDADTGGGTQADAAQGAGSLTRKAQEGAPNAWAVVSVSDDGVGATPEAAGGARGAPGARPHGRRGGRGCGRPRPGARAGGPHRACARGRAVPRLGPRRGLYGASGVAALLRQSQGRARRLRPPCANRPPPKRACKAAELSRFHATLDGSGSKKGTMQTLSTIARDAGRHGVEP